MLPIVLGIRALLKRDETHGNVKPVAGVLDVAAVTFANGGDNIGIYTPLFANSNLAQLMVLLIVFFLMVAVWCAAGYFIGSRVTVQRTIERYGHVLVPFVLIGLGIYIIVDSGTLSLLK